MEAGRIAALLLAAGSGSRAGGVPKQYRDIGGRSMLAHAVMGLRDRRIGVIQIVIGAGQEEMYRAALDSADLPAPITGGETRQESVRRGLVALASQSEPEWVLIHDAARPFLPETVLDRLLGALDAHEAAVPVLPVADTLAVAGPPLGDTVLRDPLVRVQTPQAFRFAAITAAHQAWAGGEASDDAQIARAAGIEVATVAGDTRLEKLTWEGDFARVEAQAGGLVVPRTGFGFDVHAFGPGDRVVLGGVAIPHDRGLAGHSDADVLLHAVADAILGAAAAGDIGEHFPPGDPKWRGADSAHFIEGALAIAEQQGGRLVHVDTTLVCEAPRIGPYRDAIRANLARLLRLPLGSVSVKATTTERLGFAGRGEGMAAQAIATLLAPRER